MIAVADLVTSRPMELLTLAEVARVLWPHKAVTLGQVRRVIREGVVVRGTGRRVRLAAVVMPGGTMVDRGAVSEFVRALQPGKKGPRGRGSAGPREETSQIVRGAAIVAEHPRAVGRVELQRGVGRPGGGRSAGISPSRS